MNKTEASKMSVEDLDEEIGKRGKQIAALKKEQRVFLDAKDAKIEAEVAERLSGDNVMKVEGN